MQSNLIKLIWILVTPIFIVGCGTILIGHNPSTKVSRPVDVNPSDPCSAYGMVSEGDSGKKCIATESMCNCVLNENTCMTRYLATYERRDEGNFCVRDL